LAIATNDDFIAATYTYNSGHVIPHHRVAGATR
jgi:hypothetical protein